MRSVCLQLGFTVSNGALRYLAGAGVGLISCLALALGSWLLDFGLQCLGACLLGRAWQGPLLVLGCLAAWPWP